jgi:flagellar motor protein MotB
LCRTPIGRLGEKDAAYLEERKSPCLCSTHDPSPCNLALGMRRAEAVKAFLTAEAGLMADRVRAVSYGEARNRLVAPKRQGPGEGGWENRRVALVVDYVGR